MTTENQRLAILGEALYVFVQRLESIFIDGYNYKTTATAIGLADETLAHLKEGLIHSTSEEIAASTKMRRLIDKYPTLKREGHGVQLGNMGSEVITLFKLFKVNKPEALEQALRFQLAAYRYQVISQYDLLPYEVLQRWWNELEANAFTMTVEKPTAVAQDEFTAMNQPQLLLREPRVETIEDLILVLGMMVISEADPSNTLFSNQLIRFRLTNGQTALGLLGEGDYFVIHQTNGAWEIIDGVVSDYSDEYNKLPDRLLKVLLRYALIGLVPKDLLEHVREGRQSWNLEKQLKVQLEQHESILNLIS